MKGVTASGSLIFVVALIAGGALCGRSDAEKVTPTDKRLDRPVKVRQGRIYLGELVESLSRQTGVPLSVSPNRGPVDGIELFVYLRDRPLRECMDGVRELLSSRFDQWEWQSQENKKGYVLRHQRTPSDAALAARQALMAKWSDDFKTYLDILHLPEPQRSAQAKQRPDLFGGGTLGPSHEVASRISPPQMAALLKGAFVPLDGGQSDEKFTDFVRSLGGAGEGAESSEPGFYIGWSSDQTAPSLWIRGKNGAAMSTMGNLFWAYTWVRSESSGWKCRYDPEPLAMMERVARNEAGAATTPPGNTLVEWLREAHLKQGMNVIADPGSGPRGAAPLLGRTSRETVLLLVFRGELNARRVGEIDVLRHQTSVVDFRRRLLPWPQIKALRAASDANKGFLPFKHLIALSELSDEQAGGLAEEFPDADSGVLSRWRPILQFYLNLARPAQEQILSPKGIPFRDCGLVARNVLSGEITAGRVLGANLLTAFPNEATVAFWMEKAPPVDASPPRRGQAPRDTRGDDRATQLVWEVRVAGQPVSRDVFRQSPRRPLLPEPLDAIANQLGD